MWYFYIKSSIADEMVNGHSQKLFCVLLESGSWSNDEKEAFFYDAVVKKMLVWKAYCYNASQKKGINFTP